ncbi:GLPGLI family protein [Chryseobacterium sp. JAH]|uniref:GLPGLI family protein n=1 Tax=Chryseobacterium sp. JAH TaxID=1742858 RepID=UPI0007412EE7|nr:GLPGLI family protein [Chryseobacterium sp. JAH]KUJ53078.1 hypothetical protein AR685_01440 [Chryseobacterium sp. JAH]
MKKITSLFAILTIVATHQISAQSNQFLYEYKFRLDSLSRDKSDIETMVLETSPTGSKFYSQVKAVYDSTMQATFKNAKMTQNNHFDFTSLKPAKVDDEVLKMYPGYQTKLRTRISSTPLLIENNRKIDWKITSDKDKVLGYNVQKATASLNGRKWIAWFAPEIPVQDGPYNFYGLPGLILKIEDTKGDHSFTLVGSRKVSGEQTLSLDKKAREIAVTEEKFNKLWREHKKDPVKDYRQRGSSNGGTATVTAVVSFDGKTLSQEEMMKEMEKSAKEKFKKENNYLNLNLYQ